MPKIFPAFAHRVCRLRFPFTASLPHLNCLGLGQQIFSSTPQTSPSHFSPSLWLHLWPLLASFFTFLTISQPSLAAFFICFGMKTWLQLVGKAVWRGRGREAAGSARVGSKTLLSLSGHPRCPRDAVAFLVECSGLGEKEGRAFFYFSGLANAKLRQNLSFAPRQF